MHSGPDPQAGREITLTVPPEAHGLRVDAYLAQFTEVGPSRAFVQRLITRGNVLLNGRPAKPAHRVAEGDEVWVLVPPPERPEDLQPEAIPIDVVYEDEHLLVINKPRGMVVHPGVGNFSGTLVNALLAHSPRLSGIAGVMRPGIVHRLDKDTTGLLVVAKTNDAHLGLTRQLKERTIHRIYWAIVRGQPGVEAGLVDAPIGRHPHDRLRMAVVPEGRPAVTRFTVLERFGAYSLLEVKLETGRTHQIRVHMAYIGHPIAGDPVYGAGRGHKARGELGLKAQALHARELVFVHPVTGRPMHFVAPLPEDMEQALERLRAEASSRRL
ncbi:RluA family pseudouridine synthase [Carboxydochorda subterranea]|uniref:Pseudouridine synthase n=1 Tax=Carboxydichorda subterranea TaxID=3109565 RepID=A0ABZ1C0V4_9FIRM|nr:RluA family pseudouridine synthase [Limnochorda sp. L945t]WRP18381.1 RluA family pseudouridine synthase [Limnochorda sp. L945t]